MEKGKFRVRFLKPRMESISGEAKRLKVENASRRPTKIIFKRPNMDVLGKPIVRIDDRYELGGVIGNAQFGPIRKCRKKNGGGHREAMACKSFFKDRFMRSQDIDDVKQEIEIMEILSGRIPNHPNVISLLDVLEDKGEVHIVMELCAGGDLRDRLNRVGSLCEGEAAIIFKQLIEAIKYCHDHGIVHRDVKPENILLSMDVDSDGNSNSNSYAIKLADFGLSTYCKAGEHVHGLVGTYSYMAPEVVERREYNQAADVWSAGVVLYTLLSGEEPFLGDTRSGLFDTIRDAKLRFSFKKWGSISLSAKDLIRRMLCTDPNKRLTTAQILDHPWIARGQVSDNVSSSVGSVEEHDEDITCISSSTSFESPDNDVHTIQNYIDERNVRTIQT